MKMIPPVARSVSPYFHLRFAGAGDTWVDEWYRFNSLAEIPSCAKYGFPNQVSEFRVPHGCNDFQIVQLDLMAALSALPEAERLTLNPARWDHVKKKPGRRLVPHAMNECLERRLANAEERAGIGSSP